MRTKKYERKTAEWRGSAGIWGGAKPPCFWLIMGVVLACVIIPGLVLGQVTLDPDGPVDYGATITTDREKLFACYSLAQQVIDEYNRQSVIATEDAKLADKFRTYVKKEFDPRLHQLIAEQNHLKRNIRLVNYTDVEWRGLCQSVDAMDDAQLTMFGNRSAEQTKPTVATSPLLDELKAINLDSLSALVGTDPTVDFTSATWNSGTPQANPNGHITSVTADVITTVGLKRDEDCWFYGDYLADHFDDSFEHRHQLVFSAYSGTSCLSVCWGLSNDIDDIYGLALASKSFLVSCCRYYLGSYIQVRECDSGSSYADTIDITVGATVYYVTDKRDEDIGTYGTMYVYLCTGNYYGESGSSLVGSVSWALHSSKKDYRYLFGAQTYNDGGSGSVTFTNTYLDLQEGAPEAVGYSFGYIIGG